MERGAPGGNAGRISRLGEGATGNAEPRSRVQMKMMRSGPIAATALVTAALSLAGTPAQAALRVCADPGNMPLSNNKGEGF